MEGRGRNEIRKDGMDTRGAREKQQQVDAGLASSAVRVRSWEERVALTMTVG